MKTLTVTNPIQITLIEPQQPQLAVLSHHTGKVALTNLAAIYLSRLISLPIERIAFIERLGYIVLVAYRPHGYEDPVLPIPLVDMGPEFFENFSALALHLQEWRRGLYKDEQRQWLKAAYKKLDAVIKALEDRAELSQGERQYFLFQLALSVARPGRSR